MKHKIVYFFPLEIYLMEKNVKDVREIVINILYSILTVNANLNNEIVVFTDFKGMSILSILPLNFKLIHSNNIHTFYSKMISELQNEKYVLLTENPILKMCTSFNDEYIINFKINDDAIITDIDTNDILINIKEISNILYEKFIERIKKYVK